ncbi:MAG: ATP-binding cassette domain-containing protein, partial [Limnochordales bacterium]
MTTPTLVLERLDVNIGRVPILRSVSLTVPSGSIVGLVGHNGAGRTTTLRTVMGLLPRLAGRIRADRRRTRRQDVGDQRVIIEGPGHHDRHRRVDRPERVGIDGAATGRMPAVVVRAVTAAVTRPGRPMRRVRAAAAPAVSTAPVSAVSVRHAREVLERGGPVGAEPQQILRRRDHGAVRRDEERHRDDSRDAARDEPVHRALNLGARRHAEG